MLEPLGLVMNLVPAVAEVLEQELGIGPEEYEELVRLEITGP